MSITKFAIAAVAVIVGGFLIVKNTISKKGKTGSTRKKVFSVNVEDLSYDTLIADIKQFYHHNIDSYRNRQCKLQILNSKPATQMYTILKNEDPSLNINIGAKCISIVFFVDGDIEYIKFFSYKTIDQGLKDIFSSGRDIFEQEID